MKIEDDDRKEIPQNKIANYFLKKYFYQGITKIFPKKIFLREARPLS